MHDDHGDVAGFWVNVRASDLPIHRRALRTVANLLRRVTTPPHDCCGRPGEPGC